AAADRKALHARDHRLWHVADERLQLIDGQPERTAPAIAALMLALISTGAERAIPRPRKHDHRDRLVPTGTAEGIDQLFAGFRGKGIVLVRTVDGDPRHAVAHLEENVLVIGHDSSMHGEAAGYADRLAGDVGGIVRQQEGDQPGIILRPTEPAHRDRALEP